MNSGLTIRFCYLALKLVMNHEKETIFFGVLLYLCYKIHYKRAEKYSAVIGMDDTKKLNQTFQKLNIHIKR